MLEWDNIRVFLCVARSGSIRAAAQALGVNHATVSRRVASLEGRLGVRLFEKLPTGYVITLAGEEILDISERMEAEALSLERQVYGRDAALTGSLRVTMPQAIATDLLMPDLARFADEYPGISMELTTSYETLNLTRREADVAIRLAHGSPPEHLYGRKLASVHRAVYASREQQEKSPHEFDHAPTRWITKEEDGPIPAWAAHSRKNMPGQPFVVTDLHVQLAAARCGIGAAVHFCFMGDRDTSLKRVPPGDTRSYGNLWVLTHGDLRRTSRVKVFMQFIAEAILAKRSLLEGDSGS